MLYVLFVLAAERLRGAKHQAAAIKVEQSSRAGFAILVVATIAVPAILY